MERERSVLEKISEMFKEKGIGRVERINDFCEVVANYGGRVSSATIHTVFVETKREYDRRRGK